MLTLDNLPSITTTDFCIVVGAKEGGIDPQTNEIVAPGLQRGLFAYFANPSSNYVCLLFDHLYSGIRFRFKVDEDYDKLRTIKLKELKLQAYDNTTQTKTHLKNKTKAVITLTKQTDGSSPITGITFTPDETSGNADETLFSSAEGQVLSLNYSDYMAGFSSQGVSDLTLTSSYDVYLFFENVNCAVF